MYRGNAFHAREGFPGHGHIYVPVILPLLTRVRKLWPPLSLVGNVAKTPGGAPFVVVSCSCTPLSTRPISSPPHLHSEEGKAPDEVS